MRIAVVVYGPLDQRSGGFLYDRKVVDRLRERGATVDVVSLPERAYLQSTLTNLATQLPRRLDGYDIVLEDELCHPSLLAVNRRITDTPVVALVHHLRVNEQHSWLRTQVVEAIEAAFLRSVDGFVCNSTVTRDAVREYTVPEPAVVAPPAGDRFNPLEAATIRDRASQSPLNVVAVGTVTPRKGLISLLEGLAMVDHPWQLTVAGDTQTDPEYVSRLARRAEELALGERLSLTGRIPDAQLAELMSDSQLMVLPSVREGFGIAYLEGMAFGLPAIATDNGGATDFVTHGENGYLVAPSDSAAIADHVSRVAADRELLTTLSMGALDTFQTHPGWADTGDAVYSFLSNLATGQSEPTPPGPAGEAHTRVSE